jgi:hypothetical protein
MPFTTLFFLAVLWTNVLALPAYHGSMLRRDHQLIKMSTSASLLQSLFPAGYGSSLWSTAPFAPNPVPLTTDAFKPVDMLDKDKPSFAKAPDGSDALHIHFDAGE